MKIKLHGRVCCILMLVFAVMMSIGACATNPAENTLSPEATATNTKKPRKTQKQPTLPGGNNFTYPFPNPNPDPVIDTATPVDTESPYPFPYTGPVQPADTATPVVSPTPTDVPVKTEIVYQEIGVVWQECNLADKFWQKAEECLGRTMPAWTGEDRQRLGERENGIGPIRQGIGNDVFETRETDQHNNMQFEYVLLKNNEVITTITGTFWAYDPNQSLLNVGGKIVWEFADHEFPTVIYDGVDVRGEYNVDAAYIPYDIGEKLLFVARKDGKYFVMYGGQKLGPEFDEISIAYCCEPAGWSIRRLQGQYWFWGSRDGKNYIVVISAVQ